MIDFLKFMIGILPVAVILAIFPLTIQFVLYSLGKKIFKNTFKPIIYSVSLIINSLICGALTYYLCIIDDSDLLAGFGALIIGTSWAMALFVLIIYNICQYIRFVIKK